MRWDPQQYERFAEERGRPFQDLVARIRTSEAYAVVDLGCGPGTMTATLAERWPNAAILGIDSSPEMIAAAKAAAADAPAANAPAANAPAADRLDFRVGDISTWTPAPGSVDVIVANASLQWVPDHVDLLPAWAAALDQGGTLAFQVPVSEGMAAGAAMRQIATSPRWAVRLADVAGRTGPRGTNPVRTPDEYIRVLVRAELVVDAWQTTYLHILGGEDPVLEWFGGTGLRPYLDSLPEGDRAEFRAEIGERLRQLYPRQDFGTVLPFPRLFVVGHRA